MQLDSFVFHPALSGFISLLLIFGIILFAHFFPKFFLNEKLSSIETFCVTIILISFISLPIYIGINLNMPVAFLAKTIGWFFISIAIIGIFKLFKFKNLTTNYIKNHYQILKSSNSKVDAFSILFIFLMLFLTTLGPPTDADSLDYHIGGPVRILANTLTIPSNDWLISRLILLGECFNTIGLSVGTDNLNAVFQFLTLFWLCIILTSLVQSNDTNKKISVVKFTIIPFFLLFLITSQKPQFSGVVAVITAVIIVSLDKSNNSKKYFLATGSIFYALSIKYPFYVTAFAPWCYIAWNSYKNKKIKVFLFSNIFFYFLFLFPIHLFTYLNYGSPLSPLLSKLFNEPGSLDYIHSWNLISSRYKEGFGFPFALLIPSSPGIISTSIGIGIFSFYFVDIKNKLAKNLIIVSLGTFLLTAFFCQPVSRYFADSYYLAIAAFAVASRDHKLFKIFNQAGSLQLLAMAFLSLIGAYLISPGALSWGLRDKVLSRTANGYNEAKFLNTNLPKNAVIIQKARPIAFVPRPLIASDHLFMMKYFPLEFMSRVGQYSEQRFFYTLNSEMSSNNIFYSCLISTTPFLQPIDLPFETRNPVNNSTYRRIYVYELSYEKLITLNLNNYFQKPIYFGE